MFARTEPVRTGIGAVCFEYGRRKWPITMLNHTGIPGTEKCFVFVFLAPYARTPRYSMKRRFCLKAKNGLIINSQTIIKFPDKLIGWRAPTTTVVPSCTSAIQQQSCSSQEIQRIASLHLAETLRPTALPHGSALHI